MDAELIMFLHDLVSAYLKEKEKGELLFLKQHLSDNLQLSDYLTINIL